MAMIRRLVAEDDLDDLIILSRAFFCEYETHHDAFFQIDELHDDDIVGFFSQTVGAEDGATFVAIADGRMVGYITVSVRPQANFFKIKRIGAISGLMVQQDQRRTGIGSRLLAKATAYFQERGVEYFTVFTATANKPRLSSISAGTWHLFM